MTFVNIIEKKNQILIFIDFDWHVIDIEKSYNDLWIYDDEKSDLWNKKNLLNMFLEKIL